MTDCFGQTIAKGYQVRMTQNLFSKGTVLTLKMATTFKGTPCFLFKGPNDFKARLVPDKDTVYWYDITGKHNDRCFRIVEEA